MTRDSLPAVRATHKEKKELFLSPQITREVEGGAEMVLNWKIRLARTDPISDILGVDKGVVVSGAISAIREEPQKDPKKHR